MKQGPSAFILFFLIVMVQGALAADVEMDGNVGVSGAVSASSFTGNGAALANVNHNVASCPPTISGTSFTKIEFTRSTLCIARDTFPEIWRAAENYCYSYYSGATLCTHKQVHRACSFGGLTLTVDSWLADRIGDDHALYVSATSCDNFDGDSDASSATNRAGAYCCIEWMKY